jgi:hypothetical protein
VAQLPIVRPGGTHTLYTNDGTVVLDTSKQTIYMGGQGGSVLGANATVDSAGEIEKRITATRIVFTGVFALAWRKKKDNRELYLLVGGYDFSMVAAVDPKETIGARKFAAAINTASRGGRVFAHSIAAPLGAAGIAAEKKIKEAARRAALTPEKRRREDLLLGILGAVVFLAIAGFVLYLIVMAIIRIVS